MYALVLAFCLQGDECMEERIRTFTSLSACTQAASEAAILNPQATIVYCDNLAFSSGDPE